MLERALSSSTLAWQASSLGGCGTRLGEQGRLRAAVSADGAVALVATVLDPILAVPQTWGRGPGCGG